MTEIGNSPALPASPLRHGVGLASEWYARRELPMLALLAIGAFLINLGRGFEENEYITNWVCTMDRNTLIQNRFNAGHFPYWFLWMQFWTTHLGDSEIIYRLPSVAAVVAAVFAFRATVRELFDLDRARLAALIFTIHQLTIWCAQTARPWSGILLCGALLTWGVMRWIHSRDWRWLILIAAATFVGYAHHPNFVFGVAAIAFPLLYLAVRRCAVGITPLAAMLFSILMQSHATVVLAGKQDDIVVTHEFHFRLKQGLNAASQLWFGDWKLWTEDWAKYTALLLIILASVAFWRATRSASSFHSAGLQNQPLNQCPLPPRHWSAFQRIFVLSWIWTPWTIILIIASGYAHHPMLSQIRYQTLAIGGIATLLAVAIAWWLQETGASGRKWRLIPLGAVCFLLLANTIAWWANPGNGVQKIVRRMREIYPIHCIAGYWQGFNYELRHDVECAEREGRPIQIVDLMYRDRERALAIMRDQIRSHEPFWFVINDNKNRDGKVPLGKVIKYPGPDFEIMRYESGKQKGREIKLELNDAEAVMMRRVTEWAAEGEIQASPSATTVHSE